MLKTQLMKNITTLLLLVSTLTLIGCQSNETQLENNEQIKTIEEISSETENIYRNEEIGVQFEMPENWPHDPELEKDTLILLWEDILTSNTFNWKINLGTECDTEDCVTDYTAYIAGVEALDKETVLDTLNKEENEFFYSNISEEETNGMATIHFSTAGAGENSQVLVFGENQTFFLNLSFQQIDENEDLQQVLESLEEIK